MAEYSVDYIKEKAKANYELIKILSLLSVTVGAATISLLRDTDFSQGVNSIEVELRIWITSGIITVAGLVVVILYYIVSTNSLLRKLNTPEPEEQ